MTSSTFDTLEATRALEAAGADIDQLATKVDVGWLRWIAGINLAISLATLAAVLGLAWRLLS